ncbi:S-adenosyl-L-methionine-dependent methyltransferase [Phlebopus sp. FC_14]|nr:S-adenosyl-L-methionine-dependent methyltransferase [Phlebopus sp. FC_14]
MTLPRLHLVYKSAQARNAHWGRSFHRTMSSSSVHVVAQNGFGSGRGELYDSARPSYPTDVISYIRTVASDSAAPLNIAEIGAGTGLFTRALLSHPAWAGSIATLKAIEPSADFRTVWEQKNTAKDLASITHGSFDTTGVQDNWADLVIIAQAFHWCPNYDSACAEFARILKKDGAVVFVWNLEDRDAAHWVAQLRDRIESHEAGTPQFRLGLWRQAFKEHSYIKSFKEPEENSYSYHLPASEDTCVNRALSKSYISVLEQDEKDKVVHDIRDILARGDGKVWIDESRGIFQYPYKTLVVVSRKK